MRAMYYWRMDLCAACRVGETHAYLACPYTCRRGAPAWMTSEQQSRPGRTKLRTRWQTFAAGAMTDRSALMRSFLDVRWDVLSRGLPIGCARKGKRSVARWATEQGRKNDVNLTEHAECGVPVEE